MEITTIGLDLAKSVYQVHAINDAGEVVVRRTLRRAQVLRFFEQLAPCLVGIEACGTSHYWAREIRRFGHEVRLMPPAYVKPYVKRGKTDASDAEAICEAVGRPTMRYVAIKSAEQQAALALHRTRDLFVKQRTQLVNMIRGLLAEFGIEIRRGLEQALMHAKGIAAGEIPVIPPLAAKMIAGGRSSISRRGCARSSASCSLGIARATSPNGLRRSLESASSVLRRSPPRSPTRTSSAPAGSSPLGSALHRSSIRAAVRNGWDESRRWATNICADCSSSV